MSSCWLGGVQSIQSTGGLSLVSGPQVVDFPLQLLAPRPAGLHLRLLLRLRRLGRRRRLGVGRAARRQQRLRINLSSEDSTGSAVTSGLLAASSKLQAMPPSSSAWHNAALYAEDLGGPLMCRGSRSTQADVAATSNRYGM